MRSPAFTLFLLLIPLHLLAEDAPEMDTLRARSTEQERQIRALETEIENLHSQLALERRRARGLEAPAEQISPPLVTPKNYTVQTGDTLSAIARSYNTTADALIKDNGITDPALLRVGQKISLPKGLQPVKKPSPVAGATVQVEPKPAESIKAPKPAIKLPKNTRSYTVQRGDTLYGIARRHKISMSSLRGLNPRIEDKIIVGQTISVAGQIPNPSIPKAVPVSTRPPKSTRKSISTPKPKRTSSSQTLPRSVSKNDPPAPSTNPAVDTEKQPSEPASASASASASAPAPAPALASEEPKPQKAPTPKKISSVFVSEQVSFGDFASRHGTTTTQLNQLNGWDFKESLVLARGSEIYVPAR